MLKYGCHRGLLVRMSCKALGPCQVGRDRLWVRVCAGCDGWSVIKSTVHDAMHYVLRSLCQSKGSTWCSRKSIRWRIALVMLPRTRRGGFWGREVSGIAAGISER